MSPFKSIQVRPKDGGALLTNVSSDEAGFSNYIVKRDFRRYEDREIRAEGYDYFWPNMGVGPPDYSTNPGNQPFPNVVTQKSVATITHSTTTATATITNGHAFVAGETVKVSGANESAYNGSFVISNVTRTTFDYTMLSNPPGNATGTLLVQSDMPYNLVHLARRPNLETAVIVGTATTLFRFFALGNPAYYDSDYFAAAGPDLPYYQGNPGEWIVIGQGFSPNGNRWEAVNINGYAIFNNGYDLPVTYRIEDSQVYPIYELRENGISRVGTITDYNGILMCADISEIFDTKLASVFDLPGFTSSGDITGTQAVNTVTSSAPFFTASMNNKTLIWSDGTSVDITAIGPLTGGLATSVTVNGAARTISSPGMTFTIRTKASQAGATYSGLVTGTIVTGGFIVTASSAAFNGGLGFTVGMIGKTLRFQNGWSAVISARASSTQVTLAIASPMDISQPFWVTDAASLLVSTRMATPFFTPDMVGSQLIWDTGEIRQIVAYTSASQVTVDTDIGILSGLFNIENTNSYKAYTQTQYINRIGYRVIWSMNDEPRRFGAVVQGSITAGTNTVVLDYPVKSFAVGDSVTIVGAGVDGGNLIATITGIGSLNQQWLISENADTTVSSADIERTDAINSIVGDVDLQDDGSSILKMLTLSSTLVIYKDTAIFLGVYTGDVTNPFLFTAIRVPESATLFYRHTLVNVNGEFHLYAGKNSFWRFDLVTRMPREFGLLDVCSNIFFSQATIANRELIFSADNSISREVFIVFPSTSLEKMLRFDYKQGTVSTSSMVITAAKDVKNPLTASGPTDDIFVMTVGSAVVLYGLAPSPQASWGNVKQIWYRRSAYPFSAIKGPYDSVKTSGMDAFGDAFNEKTLRSYVPILASMSSIKTGYYEIMKARNPIATPVSVRTNVIADPAGRNLISDLLLDIYFGDRLTVSGIDNPFEHAMTVWEADDIRSKSETRK